MNVFEDLSAFVYESPTPYHAVAAARTRLDAAGFTALDEAAVWSLSPGRYYVSRDGALVAFVVPSRTPRGARIVGAHTDSPNLRLKPLPHYTKEGYRQLGVEVYGGALLNSWLDRDLSLAGRVLVRQREGAGIDVRLLRIDRPLLRIPQLAIHLDREVNDKGLVLNRQNHLPPILGLAGDDDLSLEQIVANELGLDRGQIVATDLQLFDVVPPTRGGAKGELFFSPRLDNQAMCHAALTGLLEAAAAEGGPSNDLLPMAVLFDHEEVGSDTATGAGSPLVPHLVERILLALGADRGDYLRFLGGSLCVSADMAHALHPNYPDKHEARHRPRLNAGPVIKINSQQRYATCARTAAMFATLCHEANVPVQHYAHRTDLPCGSTIGPITATLMGIRTVDVGNPMLSMHSIRELAGTEDPAYMTRVLARFYAFDGAV